MFNIVSHNQGYVLQDTHNTALHGAIQTDIYIRRKEDCQQIHAGNGEYVYELIGKHSGNSQQHSLAQVEIFKNGFSQAHYDPKAEESYIITEGSGRLTISNQTRAVTIGDVVKIPVGKIHQIFNDNIETLKFYCICAPAWTPEGFIPAGQQLHNQKVNSESDEIYIKRKEDCQEINAGNGEHIYELLGLHNGNSQQHSVAQVEIMQNGHSQAHYHPKAEESYIITEGSGSLTIGDQTRAVAKGDIVKIPMGKIHQIFNDNTEALKFYCIRAPAWTLEGIVYV
ncbi:MAG: hypothetical protein K0S74_1696 [Chlamydiales bacterium]|jgi:mannose-6-phosphate isomerase-like protein (cupin superfamily)|nr:hypothetical protein [Chlamydiales bacterium]